MHIKATITLWFAKQTQLKSVFFLTLGSFSGHFAVARGPPELQTWEGTSQLWFFGQKTLISIWLCILNPPNPYGLLKNPAWISVYSSGSPLATPKSPQNVKKHWFQLVFKANHRVLVALISKSKVQRSPPRFIALGAFCRPLNDPKMTQNEKKHWFPEKSKHGAASHLNLANMTCELVKLGSFNPILTYFNQLPYACDYKPGLIIISTYLQCCL